MSLYWRLYDAIRPQSNLNNTIDPMKWMTHLWLFSSLSLLSHGLLTSQADGTPHYPIDCEMENQVFIPGERITYSLYYNLSALWIKAGELTFYAYDYGSYYHIEAHGRTVSTFEWFYKVNDVYTCDIDKTTMKPLRTSRDIQEGNYIKKSRTQYDHDAGIIHSHYGKSEDKMKELVMKMDDCMHDVLSVIYYARNLDYAAIPENTDIPVNVFLDDTNYKLGFKYMGAERKKIKNLGKYDTLVLRPRVADGHAFEDGTEMTVWITDDGNKLPLLIESPVSVGSVKAVLESYDNLRYPISAKR